MRVRTLALKMLPVLLVFAAVWLLVILYWRASNHAPTGGEIALYMLGIPVALILGFYLIKKSIDLIKGKASTPAATDTDTEGDNNDDQPPPDPDDTLTLQILGNALRLPVAGDADALVAALSDNESPDLHPSLQDHLGMPAYASTVESIDPDDADPDWDAIGNDAAETLEPTHRRALLLAAQVLDDLFEQVEELDAAKPDATSEASATQDSATPVAQPLDVLVVLPDHWPKASRDAALDWLRHHAHGVKPEHRQLQLKTLAMSDATQVLTLIDRLRVTLNHNADTQPRLLLACDSHIDEHTVHQWSTSGRLLTSGHDEGQVPGEGAAGLLLAAAPAADAADSTDPAAPGNAERNDGEDEDEEPSAPRPARLHKVARGKHEQPVGSGSGRSAKKVDKRVVSALIADALRAGACTADDVQCVVSDADLRPSRSGELIDALSADLPHLDGVDDCMHIGAGNGDCGFAAALAGLAVAAIQVRDEDAPVLFASVSDDQHRAALLVAPPGHAADSDDGNAQDAA